MFIARAVCKTPAGRSSEKRVSLEKAAPVEKTSSRRVLRIAAERTENFLWTDSLTLHQRRDQSRGSTGPGDLDLGATYSKRLIGSIERIDMSLN